MSEAVGRERTDARCGGRCEGCGRPGCQNFAHRIARSGGGLWLPSNGLRLCGSGSTGCHGWATHNPDAAEGCGWRILSGEHPLDVPAWIRSPFLVGWHLLDDHGCFTPLWDRDDVPLLPPWALAGPSKIPAGKSQR